MDSGDSNGSYLIGACELPVLMKYYIIIITWYYKGDPCVADMIGYLCHRLVGGDPEGATH